MEALSAPADDSVAKPVGISIIGALLVGASGVGVLIALGIVIALFTSQDLLVILILVTGVAVFGLLAFAAIRIGLGLLRDPAENRIAGEWA